MPFFVKCVINITDFFWEVNNKIQKKINFSKIAFFIVNFCKNKQKKVLIQYFYVHKINYIF